MERLEGQEKMRSQYKTDARPSRISAGTSEPWSPVACVAWDFEWPNGWQIRAGAMVPCSQSAGTRKVLSEG